jgi:acetate kinase
VAPRTPRPTCNRPVRILVVNAGSSSLKLRLLGSGDQLLAEHDLSALEGDGDAGQLDGVIAGLPKPEVVGHRIVHGGERFTGPALIDADVEQALRDLSDLAPLHQAKSLAALDAVKRALPEVPAVACFDTAFHATLPPAAATYALPASWRERWGVRRYGFHGLSHAYASRRAAELLGAWPARLVTCHLGAGRRWPRCATGAQSRPPWASPPWRAWSWPPGPAASTQGFCCGCLSTRS